VPADLSEVFTALVWPLSDQANLNRRLAAELIGTFVFVLVGAGSALGAESLPGANSGTLLLTAALANGLGLAIAVSATMGISGGVLNPAATVGLWVGGRLQARDVFPYIVVQLVGAIGAGLTLVLVFPSSLGGPVMWGSPTLSVLLNTWQGTAVEMLLTFVLVIAIFCTAADPRAPKIGGIGIGLALLVDVLVGGNLTGAAMNPARAFGPMVAGGFFPGYWYIYLVGPVIGAVIAGTVYRYALSSSE
jgi:MIP family channel proteins